MIRFKVEYYYYPRKPLKGNEKYLFMLYVCYEQQTSDNSIMGMHSVKMKHTCCLN